jgi:hypothetical protein
MGTQRLKLIYPISYLASQLSMTGLLVSLGLGGNLQLAADVGVVQGAALALFFAFSGNARNLIFKSGGVAPARSIMQSRLILMLPLAAGVYFLGSVLGGVAWDISLILILRKSVEWLSEIHLSEAEQKQDAAFAWRHLVIQSGLLATAVIWAITDTPGFLLVLMAWAIVPLLISFPYLQRVLRGTAATRVSVQLLLPHLGSTAVMGIGVYVFRLTILLLVDRAVAGSLYTAFAIGGVLGSIFAMGLGPSMVLHEQKTGQMQMPIWLRAALVMATLAGIAVTAISHIGPDTQVLAGKDMLFWQALGFSLIGGVVMVFAQRQRLRDLQHGTQADVFAPDVLVNMLIVIFIPTIYLIFGNHGLTWLYLFNAMVALVFYWMTDVERATMFVGQRHVNKLRAVLAVLLVSPIFVNLGTGLFRDPTLMYDSGGLFSKLPIPLSVFGCYVGIALLGNYRRANLGLTIIFGSFVLMVLSTVATTFGSRPEEQAKLILLMQYILPMFGLVLGMMYEDLRRNEHVVEKVMLLVITALMPAQLLASWAQSQMFLTPYLYLFSIYQHLQYVPVIVASSYLVALFSLWNIRSWRMLTIALAPLIGIYIAASGSMLAAVFLLIGSVAFAVHAMGIEKRRGGRINEWLIFALVSGAGIAYNIWASWTTKFEGVAGAAGAGQVGMYTQKVSDGALSNVQFRLDTWLYYLHGIFSESSTFVFGHSAPPDRQTWPSAHNYYLDLIYNYGAIGVLMIAGLIVFTLVRINQNRKLILASPAMIGLTIVVMFLLFPDNLMKVSMRQPYSGIITFFLWGLLLARIESLRPPERGEQPIARHISRRP